MKQAKSKEGNSFIKYGSMNDHSQNDNLAVTQNSYLNGTMESG